MELTGTFASFLFTLIVLPLGALSGPSVVLLLRVGFMRHGRLLAEDSPDSLLHAHAALSLEQVFLNLCQVLSYSC